MKTNFKDMEDPSVPLETATSDNSTKPKNMDMEYIFGTMETYMMEIGLTTNSTAPVVSFTHQAAKPLSQNGTMED